MHDFMVDPEDLMRLLLRRRVLLAAAWLCTALAIFLHLAANSGGVRRRR